MSWVGANVLMKALEFVRLELRPMPRQLRLGLLGALAALVPTLVYFGLFSDTPLPDHRLIVGWNDTLLHMAAFGSLALLLFPLLSPMLRVAAYVMLLGIGLELFQAFSPYHEPSLGDVFADATGISVAAVTFFALRLAVNLVCQRA